MLDNIFDYHSPTNVTKTPVMSKLQADNDSAALEAAMRDMKGILAALQNRRPSTDMEVEEALKKLGFKYVGSTTMYALMQSTGMVQDHAPGCFKNP